MSHTTGPTMTPATHASTLVAGIERPAGDAREPGDEGAAPAGDDCVRSRSPLARLAAELSEHPFGYGILAAFTAAGPLVVHFLFPDAPLLAGLIGGFVFGGYAALCAVPDDFF
jgi:hypothetical protein